MQEGCAPDEKLCPDGYCVSKNDPTAGCGNPECQPCAYPGGVSTCRDGACHLANCLDPWSDCNADASDGCETNTSLSSSNCKTCKNPACISPPANVKVTACLADREPGDTCGIEECEPGWGDCDDDPKNGCEVQLSTSSENCYECGKSCHGAPCVDGACVDASAPESVPDAG
jgi:hypothetical protein